MMIKVDWLAACIALRVVGAVLVSQVEYNCVMIKVDWLAACIALRVAGAELVEFLRRWRKICTILYPMGKKGRYLKKSAKPC